MKCPNEGVVGVLLSLLCALFWYMFSIGLTFYNKWLFRTYDLHFPLTVTSWHMVTNFLFSWICRAGIALYTMCKSTSIIFLLLFAFCFGIEQPRWSLTAVILSIGIGIALFTYGGNAHFHLGGFLMVLTATVMAGLRWVLTQILLQKKTLGLHNPIDTLYHVTPVMALVLMPIALALEGVEFFASSHMFLGKPGSELATLGVVTVGAVLAFAMNVSEFLLISRTSSVTMSVAGIFKEVCTIGLSVLLLGETMSLLNVIGMVVTIGGIVLYNVIKFRQAFGPNAPGREGDEQDYAKLRNNDDDCLVEHIEMRDPDGAEESAPSPVASKYTEGGVGLVGAGSANGGKQWAVDDESDEDNMAL